MKPFTPDNGKNKHRDETPRRNFLKQTLGGVALLVPGVSLAQDTMEKDGIESRERFKKLEELKKVYDYNVNLVKALQNLSEDDLKKLNKRLKVHPTSDKDRITNTALGVGVGTGALLGAVVAGTSKNRDGKVDIETTLTATGAGGIVGVLAGAYGETLEVATEKRASTRILKEHDGLNAIFDKYVVITYVDILSEIKKLQGHNKDIEDEYNKLAEEHNIIRDKRK